MGVDVKLRKYHVTIGNHEGIFRVLTVPTLDEVEDLRRKYNATMVIDGNPITGQRELMKRNAGQIFCCFYTRDKEKKRIVRWGDKDEYGYVNVDRTNMIQETIDDFVKGRIKFTTDGISKEAFIKTFMQEYIQNWLNIYRKTEEDNFGIPHSTWETNGPDDYVHSTIYWKLALMKVPKPTQFVARPHFGFEAGTLPEYADEIIDGTIPADKFPLFASEDEGDWRSVT